MVIHESAEDYLESILILHQRRGMVRSIDIVNELGYSMKAAWRSQTGSTAVTRRSQSSLRSWELLRIRLL